MAKLFVPLDVDWASDDKILAAGPVASYLFLASLGFAKRTMSDGRIARAQLLAIAPGVPNAAKHAATLVEVGLWNVTSEGWTIPSWLKSNPSRAHIEAASELASENGVRGNHIKHHVNEGKPSSKCKLCVEERLIEKSGQARPPDRVPEADPIAKGREGKPESEPEPQGSQSHREHIDPPSSSVSSRVSGEAAADDEDDPLTVQVMNMLATAWTRENATEGKERAYRVAVMKNAEDHLPTIRQLVQDHPGAKAETIAAAYERGSWEDAKKPKPTEHAATCVCDGSGLVPVDPNDTSRSAYWRPCTAEQNLATVLPMRGAS